MTPENAILWAITIPLIGSLGILLAGKIPNLRESITLITAVLMFVMVGSLIHVVTGGGRPSVT